MSYLEQLKLENTHPDALPKLTKPPFDSFDSRGGRHFPEKKAPVAVVALATPDGPRTIEAPDPERITGAGLYQGEPDQAAVDVADAALTFMADLGRPCTEREITEALGGDPVALRAILRRLVLDGIAELAGAGLYAIPPWPPRAPDLPVGCPLIGDGPHPKGCRFDARLLRRMMAEGALPLPGGRCPLRAVCGVERKHDGDGEP